MKITATKTLELYDSKLGRNVKCHFELSGDTDQMLMALARRAYENKSNKATALENGVAVEIIVKDGRFVYDESGE